MVLLPVSNPRVSIIIPVYNTDSYLRKCIDSVLNQTVSDFELLLIDDGSSDGCSSICDEYSQHDYRIKVIHKKNQGVSVARNVGLDLAKGYWITFVDSDDWIESTYLETLLNFSDADIVMGYYTVEGWNEWISEPFENKRYENISEFLTKYALKSNFMVAKLFRRSIIEYNNLRFDTTISYGEDTLFIFSYLRYVSSIHTDSKVIYNYNCYGSMLSKQYRRWNSYRFILDKLLSVLEDLERVFKWNGEEVKSSITIQFINKYMYGLSCNHSINEIRKGLKPLLLDSFICQTIKENKFRSRKGKFVDRLLLNGYLSLVSFILFIKFRC